MRLRLLSSELLTLPRHCLALNRAPDALSCPQRHRAVDDLVRDHRRNHSREHVVRDGFVAVWAALLAGSRLLQFRQFALIDENDGFFVSCLKASSNPMVAKELQEWPGRAIPLEGERIYDAVGNLYRQHIGVEVEVTFQRRVYDGGSRGIPSGSESSSVTRTPTTVIDCTSESTVREVQPQRDFHVVPSVVGSRITV